MYMHDHVETSCSWLINICEQALVVHNQFVVLQIQLPKVKLHLLQTGFPKLNLATGNTNISSQDMANW